VRTDVNTLQKRFVRYSSDTSAETVAYGWSKDASVRAQRLLRSGASEASMAKLPEALSLEILRAPSEFAVPVKQDRCGLTMRVCECGLEGAWGVLVCTKMYA
jgi:hypothetical protein